MFVNQTWPVRGHSLALHDWCSVAWGMTRAWLAAPAGMEKAGEGESHLIRAGWSPCVARLLFQPANIIACHSRSLRNVYCVCRAIVLRSGIARVHSHPPRLQIHKGWNSYHLSDRLANCTIYNLSYTVLISILQNPYAYMRKIILTSYNIKISC